MSEINVAAVLYPKPDKIKEVETLVAGVIKDVQENEPDTLVYYAIKVQDKPEIVIIEKYKNQAAVKAHVKSTYFREFSAKMASLVTKPPEIRAGSLLPVSRL